MGTNSHNKKGWGGGGSLGGGKIRSGGPGSGPARGEWRGVGGWGGIGGGVGGARCPGKEGRVVRRSLELAS